MTDSACWFAMRATYRRELKAKELMEKLAIEAFVPMRNVIRVKDGHKYKSPEPAVGSLIFVRSTKRVILEAKKSIPFLQFMMKKENDMSVPIVVPDSQMEQFIRVTETMDKGLLFFSPEELDLKKGVKVRIHGGLFDKIEGIFLKVKGARSKRVVILLQGVSAVATAEISPDLIEVIE